MSLKPRPKTIETLESRQLLHGGVVVWDEVGQLDLSFAPDGVDIAGEENSLFNSFDQKFGQDAWQDTILRAFQTWAVETNANIGVISENGLYAFGAVGRRVGDERFGDIRIGARSLGDETQAVAVSQNSLVSGTWTGDVIFNKDADINSLQKLYAVTLHEAGHVFGLGHSDNEASVMHLHGGSDVVELADEDIEDLTALYGDRDRDVFEGRGGNDRRITATSLSGNSRGDHVDGSAPIVLFADITTDQDVDFYRLRTPEDYDGDATLQIRTEGISLLAPSLVVTNERGDILQESSVATNRGGLVEVNLSNWEGSLFLRVGSNRDDVHNIGAYSLTVTFNGVNEVDREVVDYLSGDKYRGYEIEDIKSYFESGDRRSFHDDEHSDDRHEQARDIQQTRQTESLSRMSTLGSLSDSGDIDYYRAESPGREFASESVGYISVQSLDAGGLIPTLYVYDDRLQPIDYDVLVNGNGELMIQIAGLRPDTDFQVAVGSQSEVNTFQRGNYELQVTFTENPTVLETYVSGEVANDAVITHRLRVAAPQLFHFSLAVDGHDSKSGVLINLIDADDQVVHDIVAPRGQTRTNGNVLLMPGEYTLQAVPLTLENTDVGTMSFTLSGIETSDPFGIVPGSSDTVYNCEDIEDQFCFPDGSQSTVPFDWDELIEDFGTLFLDAVEASDLLLADWWEAYWDSDDTVTAPVSAAENYDANIDGELRVSSENGVLANDSSELAAVVFVTHYPTNGSLEMSLEGGFVYTPDFSFVGIDSFEYVASNFRNSSDPTTVKIAVGVDVLAGDLDDDGAINASDINLLSSAIQDGDELRFDLNTDGFVDVDDHRFLVMNLLRTTFGDANLDGQFDSRDLVMIFQEGVFETGLSAGWEHGDWNSDRKFDTADLVAAFQFGVYVP